MPCILSYAVYLICIQYDIHIGAIVGHGGTEYLLGLRHTGESVCILFRNEFMYFRRVCICKLTYSICDT